MDVGQFHSQCSQALCRVHDIAEVERHFNTSKSRYDNPVIPDPSLFKFSHDGGPNSDIPKVPTVTHCAVHLEFLTVLHVLRHNILASKAIDNAMGYKSTSRPRKALLDQWHIGKWTKFVEFAVVRFLVWRSFINHHVPKDDANAGTAMDAHLKHEVPLDVLMVWHAFMLNPGMYKKHCRNERIYNLAFPWEAIHGCVRGDKWEYWHKSTHKSIMSQFGMPHDLLQQFESWPYPKEQSPGHQYPGLDTFEVGKGQVRGTNGLDAQHDTMVDACSKAFRDAKTVLAQQLKLNVLRQEDFISKMVDYMWIRSPEVAGTLKRAISRYTKFVELMKREPGMVVPAPDIDLVWHTHQCDGGKYASEIQDATGRFVDHNDRVSAARLKAGFDKTRQLWRRHFGQEYRSCGCWECELLTSEMEKVRDTNVTDIHLKEICARGERRLLYFRAVESMRRQGLPMPIWEEQSRFDDDGDIFK